MTVLKKWTERAKGWLRASLLRRFALLIMVTGVLILALNILFISHFYSNSLLSGIEAVEADYMRMQADNLEVQIRNYRNRLLDAVLDTGLLNLAKQHMSAPPADRAMVERSILERISSSLQYADIAAATLVLPNGEMVFKSRLKGDTRNLGWFGYDGGRTDYDHELDALCERTLQARNVRVGLEPHVYPLTGTYLIHMACPLFDMFTREIYGTVVFSFNTRTLRDMTNPTDGASRGKSSTGVLTSEDGVVIAHERAELIGQVFTPGEADAAGIEREPREHVLSQALGLFGFKLYRVIDKNILFEGPRRYTFNMTLMLCLIIVATLILATLMARRMMRSVRALQNGLMSVQSGNLDVLVQAADPDEIGQIIRSFNDMAGQLRRSDRQRRIQEQQTIDALNRRRIAEIKALENQINSHFLYNTLNSINYTALNVGNLDVSRQLKHLSHMLRYTFERSDGIVTAAREAEWLGEYLALQKLRYGETFDYRITLDSDVEEWPMRKLLLQPFIENCLMHGLAGRTRGGRVVIDFRPHSGERLRVTITDNGCGIPPDQMDKLRAILNGDDTQDEVGIGLENAMLRIRTYYHGEARVILRSWPGTGTKVVLLLPAYHAEPLE